MSTINNFIIGWLLVSLCLLIGISNSFAQNCPHQLKGVLLDQQTSSPLPFATVYISEVEQGNVTDSLGQFNIPQVCSGSYLLSISYIGYKGLDTLVTIPMNAPISLTLRPLNEQLDDFTIEDQRHQRIAQAVQSISGIELQTKAGGDLAATLREMPGVQALKTSATAAKPVIHGLHGNRILILTNGVRLEAQQWRLDYAPEIDPFIAQNITLVQGANSVRYGSDAIGGVVLLNPPPLRKNTGIGGEINLIGFSNNRQGTASGMLDGQFKKTPDLSWRIQGTLARGGNAKAPDYYLDNTGIKEYNFSGEIGYQKERYGISTFYSQYNSEFGIYRGSHNHNLRDIIDIFEGEVPPDTTGFSYEILRPRQSAEHELFKVGAYFKPTEKGTLRATYARQFNRREEFDITHGQAILDENLAPQLGLKLTTHSVDLSWDQTINSQWESTIGLSTARKRNNFSGVSFIPRYTSLLGGIYTIQTYTLGALQLEGGLRYDFENREVELEAETPTFNYSNISYNLGANYRISNFWHLNANIGRAWRATTVAELFSDGVNHGEAAVELGNPNLDSERVFSGIVGLKYNNFKGLRSNLTVYYKQFQNYIFLAPASYPTLTIRGIFPTYNYEQAKARFTGADFDTEIPIRGGLSAFFRGSVLRAYNQTADDDLILIPPNNFSYGVKYQLNNDGPLDQSFIRVSMQHFNRQNHFPDSTEIILPPDAYQLLQVDAVARIQLKKQPIYLGFSIYNALNRTYRSYLNRMRYFADEPGRNVVIRLKVPFGRDAF